MAQYRGMHFIRVLQLIFALNVVKIVGGSVTITESGTEAGNGAYECGEKLTLTCEISGNPNTMSWQNDSSNIPLAQCVFQNCELNPDVVGKFEFSFNNSIGVYNLTFDVMNENNGISYMCEDGTDFSQTIITVKDLKPTLIKTDQQRLKAVSGCIDPNEKVTFTWKKIQATNNEESQYHTSCLNEQEFDDTKTCQSDTKCGGPNLIQKLMSIDDEEGGPDDYYLKVVLSYNGVEMESALTNDTHKVNLSFKTADIVYTAFIYIFIVWDIIAVVVFYYKLKDCSIITYSIAITVFVIPVHVSFIMITYKLSECSDDTCSKMCENVSCICYPVVAYIIGRFFFGLFFNNNLKMSCIGIIIVRRTRDFAYTLFVIPPPLAIILLICWLVYASDKSKQESRIGERRADLSLYRLRLDEVNQARKITEDLHKYVHGTQNPRGQNTTTKTKHDLGQHRQGSNKRVSANNSPVDVRVNVTAYGFPSVNIAKQTSTNTQQEEISTHIHEISKAERGRKQTRKKLQQPRTDSSALPRGLSANFNDPEFSD